MTTCSKIWLCYRDGQRSKLSFFNQIVGLEKGSIVLRTLTFSCQACANHPSLFLFPSQMKPMLTTIGTLDPPLGNARLQASKLIAAILATNSDTINAELASLGTLQVLWVSIQSINRGVTFCHGYLHNELLLSFRVSSVDQ